MRPGGQEEGGHSGGLEVGLGRLYTYSGLPARGFASKLNSTCCSALTISGFQPFRRLYIVEQEPTKRALEVFGPPSQRLLVEPNGGWR